MIELLSKMMELSKDIRKRECEITTLKTTNSQIFFIRYVGDVNFSVRENGWEQKAIKDVLIQSRINQNNEAKSQRQDLIKQLIEVSNV